jgi:hypothetical protein
MGHILDPVQGPADNQLYKLYCAETPLYISRLLYDERSAIRAMYLTRERKKGRKEGGKEGKAGRQAESREEKLLLIRVARLGTLVAFQLRGSGPCMILWVLPCPSFGILR